MGEGWTGCGQLIPNTTRKVASGNVSTRIYQALWSVDHRRRIDSDSDSEPRLCCTID